MTWDIFSGLGLSIIGISMLLYSHFKKTKCSKMFIGLTVLGLFNLVGSIALIYLTNDFLIFLFNISSILLSLGCIVFFIKVHKEES